ncbi:hypothetical protein L3Y34_001400 [Caenorhabditis briggsae]|uniref:Uncharacterized protein n=1 Tax=Caenorhabditis briggsae TaxID=6238 RepID=A0AAE9IQK7_CAEBR|nr:hypothetical protein L3Y34_001400 [Caenorhabditis briggsae]
MNRLIVSMIALFAVLCAVSTATPLLYRAPQMYDDVQFVKPLSSRKTLQRRAHQRSFEHEPQQVVWSWSSMRCVFSGSHFDYRFGFDCCSDLL